MAKIINFDERLGQYKASIRDAHPNVRNGMRLFENLSREERELITGFIFGMIKFDVRTGLTGEDAEIFFDEIDAIYEEFKAEAQENLNKCFFCDEDADAGICLKHLMNGIGIDNMEDFKKFVVDGRQVSVTKI